jgi:hypothetical protein
MVTLFLPFHVACTALLALFWVGAFPDSWPRIGGSNRFGRFLFWVFTAVFGAFWLYFYGHVALRLF